MSLYPHLLFRIGHDFIVRLQMRIGGEQRRMQLRVWKYERKLKKDNLPATELARLRALHQRALNASDTLERRKQKFIWRLHRVAVKFKCLFKQVVVPDFRPSTFAVLTAAITQSLGALHHKVRYFIKHFPFFSQSAF